jgi:hypothetical protein
MDRYHPSLQPPLNTRVCAFTGLPSLLPLYLAEVVRLSVECPIGREHCDSLAVSGATEVDGCRDGASDGWL